MMLPLSLVVYSNVLLPDRLKSIRFSVLASLVPKTGPHIIYGYNRLKNRKNSATNRHPNGMVICVWI